MVTLVKKANQKNMCLSCPMPLVKVDILKLVNADILVNIKKLNFPSNDI